LVTSLGREDDGGDGGVLGVGDVLSGTRVGRDTDVLNQSGEPNERLDVGVRAGSTSAEHGGKGWCNSQAVLARGDGVFSERTREGCDVGRLVHHDLLIPATDPVGVTGGGEISRGEVGESICATDMDQYLNRECLA